MLAVRGLIVWAPLCGLRAWTDRASSVRARTDRACSVRAWTDRENSVRGLIVLACRARTDRVRGRIVWIDTPFYWHRTKKRESN